MEKFPACLLDELPAEDGTAKRTVHNIVSQARKDLQPLQKPDLLPTAKNSGGYYSIPCTISLPTLTVSMSCITTSWKGVIHLETI